MEFLVRVPENYRFVAGKGTGLGGGACSGVLEALLATGFGQILG